MAYQEKNGETKDVQVAYLVNGDTYGFKLGDYDPALPLVIDPCLSYSTFFGGANEDMAFSMAVDSIGNAYIAGYTNSDDFPSSNEYAGDFDAFVIKIDPTKDPGEQIVYSTFFGGDLYDAIYDIAFG